jgi:hypothetical protein
MVEESEPCYFTLPPIQGYSYLEHLGRETQYVLDEPIELDNKVFLVIEEEPKEERDWSGDYSTLQEKLKKMDFIMNRAEL